MAKSPALHNGGKTRANRGALVTCALAVDAAKFRVKSTFAPNSFTSTRLVIVQKSANTVRIKRVRNVSAKSAFANTTSEEAMAEKVVIAAACSEARTTGARITFSAFGTAGIPAHRER